MGHESGIDIAGRALNVVGEGHGRSAVKSAPGWPGPEGHPLSPFMRLGGPMRLGRRRVCGRPLAPRPAPQSAAPSVPRGTTAAAAPAVRPSPAARGHAVPQDTRPAPQEERPSARRRWETARPPATKAEPRAAHRYSSKNSQTSFQRSLSSAVPASRMASWAKSWGDSPSPHVLRTPGTCYRAYGGRSVQFGGELLLGAGGGGCRCARRWRRLLAGG
jgi:hypothetical protein